MAELTPQGSEARAYLGVPNKLRYTDQKALCSLACMCQHAPDISRSGQSLKQNCMARNLDTINRMQPSKAYYKPEVSYDMTQHPPAPILESNPPAGQEPQKHGSWMGWKNKYWDDPDVGRPPYQTGVGLIRRPDIVIVNDPLKSPTQDNIYQVVEVKFPGDPYREGQKQAYAEIAGDVRRFVAFNVQDDCGCDDSSKEYKQEEALSRVKAEEFAPARFKSMPVESPFGRAASISSSAKTSYDEETSSEVSGGLLTTILGLMLLGSVTPSS